jgi:uncharacterized protein (TIGR04222 family)
MTGDTWGMSGPQFLEVFAIVAVAGLVIALAWRRAAMHTDRATVAPGPEELAYLNGGDSLAVHTSVTGLRMMGAITGGPTAGTLVATGPARSGLTDLDHAVHTALTTPRQIDDLEWEQGVVGALRRLRERLETDGLLLSPGRRAAARTAALVMSAVTALGVARIVAGLGNHKPVAYVSLLTLVTAVVALRLLAVPKLGRSGRRLLAQARGGTTHLQPRRNPSWATYGVGGAMLGVALYGTAALWASDPAFASYAGIAQASAVSSGSSYSASDGGSSCSGGSSCGGGGCGGGGCGG